MGGGGGGGGGRQWEEADRCGQEEEADIHRTKTRLKEWPLCTGGLWDGLSSL